MSSSFQNKLRSRNYKSSLSAHVPLLRSAAAGLTLATADWTRDLAQWCPVFRLENTLGAGQAWELLKQGSRFLLVSEVWPGIMEMRSPLVGTREMRRDRKEQLSRLTGGHKGWSISWDWGQIMDFQAPKLNPSFE